MEEEKKKLRKTGCLVFPSCTQDSRRSHDLTYVVQHQTLSC